MTDFPSNASLTIKTGPDSGKVVELKQKELVIGRSAPADLIIVHPEISRRHAHITWQQGQYFLEDLGSSNGTFLNGQPVHAPQVLANGAEIQLGASVSLVFRQQPSAAPTVAVSSAAQTVAAFLGGRCSVSPGGSVRPDHAGE